MTYILIALFIIVIGLVLYTRSKLAGILVVSTPVVILTGWWVLVSNHYFVPSTNLENEAVGEFRLLETLAEDQLDSLGTFEERKQENGYSYQNEDHLHLSTDEENRILSVSSGESHLEASSGLKVGDRLSKAKALYGDHFYTYQEMGLGEATVYVDRENQFLLTLWSKDEMSISSIWLSTIH
ncbi:hypothetical protein [Jeotgalibacillus salarius]|uniref:Uncharacterized protein n=1 Tax=Jeotgalibacillus salarius TaxID=546023 RepID=A0A4Y8LM24_9BACL|nr:hypothetical protein [Jeotgalibacillus salarius]TFE02307.1 hypothetical protein E2626_06935 [Jeotgalibacillus salarius]